MIIALRSPHVGLSLAFYKGKAWRWRRDGTIDPVWITSVLTPSSANACSLGIGLMAWVVLAALFHVVQRLERYPKLCLWSSGSVSRMVGSIRVWSAGSNLLDVVRVMAQYFLCLPCTPLGLEQAHLGLEAASPGLGRGLSGRMSPTDSSLFNGLTKRALCSAPMLIPGECPSGFWTWDWDWDGGGPRPSPAASCILR